MPTFALTVNARRSTTRQGDHSDDVAYLEQLAGTVANDLAELAFKGTVSLILLTTEGAEGTAHVGDIKTTVPIEKLV